MAKVAKKAGRNLSLESINAIRRMIAAVKSDPKSYNQQDFPVWLEGTCTTAFCAAGHAILVNKGRKEFDRISKFIGKSGKIHLWSKYAADALGITKNRDVLFSLFDYYENWPNKFAKQYDKAKSQRGRVSAFERRWEFFIATDGTDKVLAA